MQQYWNQHENPSSHTPLVQELPDQPVGIEPVSSIPINVIDKINLPMADNNMNPDKLADRVQEDLRLTEVMTPRSYTIVTLK